MNIDVHKYQKIVVKAAKSEHAEVKMCAQKDILKLKDAKSEASLQEWWKYII